MPTPQYMTYPDSIEPLVQFIEDTSPADILDAALAKLREGTPIQEMLTASALAVTRSTEMPPGHHGGPLHPLAGLYAVTKLVERLDGEEKYVPVLQHVALSNKHIHHPAMGPYRMPDFSPLNGGGVEGSKQAFLMAVGRGEWNQADHLFQYLWKNAPAIECFDLLLTAAIPKNFHDDHYFMFPSTLWRAIDKGVLDEQYMAQVMRPAVRYVTRNPVAPPNPIASPFPQIDALIEEHQLLKRVLRQRTGDDETAAIGELGEAIGRVEAFSEIPVLNSQALADGLSIEGVGAALSIGAARLFMRSLGGNPMDVHLHTSVNIRRYLIALDGISIKNKVMLLLTWHTGPEIRSTANRMQPPGQPEQAKIDALPKRSQEELLEEVKQSIYNQPPTDWSQVSNLGLMRAVPEVRHTVNLAAQYMQAGYDHQAFIAMLAEVVCHDSFTEMHAFKHHQSIVEEYYATQEEKRWMHLVCGAQAAAISFGKNMAVFEEYLDLLHAA
jgi:hypothetical protein